MWREELPGPASQGRKERLKIPSFLLKALYEQKGAYILGVEGLGSSAGNAGGGWSWDGWLAGAGMEVAGGGGAASEGDSAGPSSGAAGLSSAAAVEASSAGDELGGCSEEAAGVVSGPSAAEVAGGEEEVENAGGSFSPGAGAEASEGAGSAGLVGIQSPPSTSSSKMLGGSEDCKS